MEPRLTCPFCQSEATPSNWVTHIPAPQPPSDHPPLFGYRCTNCDELFYVDHIPQPVHLDPPEYYSYTRHIEGN